MLVILAFIVLGYLMSNAGVRGSDQYWYVADTESLISGKGVQTNNILPNNIINDSTIQNAGFIHNVPQVYMAVLPGILVGAFNGWLLMNLILNILTFLFLYLTLKRFFAQDIAMLVALLYLVLPLTFWHTYQPLAEVFHAFLIMSMLYSYFVFTSIRRYYIIAGLSVILFLCRNNYILVLIIIPILYFRDNSNKYRLANAIFMLIVILASAFSLKILLPDTWNFSFYDNLVTSKIGNTELSFSTFITLFKIYVSRFIMFFKIQFFSINYLTVFYLPFNLFAIGSLILWLKDDTGKTKIPSFLVLFSMFFLMLTAVISQNQARYMLPFYPVVIFGFCIQLKNTYPKFLLNKIFSKLLLTSIIISLLINSVITNKTLQEGKSEYEVRHQYANLIDETIPPSDAVICSSKNYILLGYILRPRKMFLFEEKTYLVSDRYTDLIQSKQINWLFTDTPPQDTVFTNYYLHLERVVPDVKRQGNNYLYSIRNVDSMRD